MELSLSILFLDGTSIWLNNIAITNYNDMYTWLTTGTTDSFVCERSNGTQIILYKNAIKYVDVFSIA
ncbi:hypothetical protein [Clostridium sp. UBA6640]|uniref:hypothetical protein n=1 Tax=Clostridium sp. UBA6640 TaxID=1946370 RepID=UPI0025BF3CF1|nr:hypothetical protein [Clostridium sp. UBA6640]